MIVGYAYVVADILHIGHIRALRQEKNMVDKLIVGVLTDKATMEKKKKPTVPFDERFEIVSSLKFVDMVVTQETYSPYLNVIKLKPDVLFESSSHSIEALSDARYLMEALGGRLFVVPYYSQHSSTRIKKKIKHDKS